MLGLVTQICGFCATAGLVVVAVVKRRGLVDLAAEQVPLLLAVVGLAASGLVLLVRGIGGHFAFANLYRQDRSRSPDLGHAGVGLALLLLATAGLLAL